MKTRRFGLMGLVMLACSMAVPAQAMWTDLTAEQAKRAEKVGGFNASAADPTKFMQLWVVNLGEGKGGALLMTEFLSVAFAAQEAVHNFAALMPWEIQDAISRARHKLVFSVTTFADGADYADGLRGWVIADGKRIQNTHWQNGVPTAYKGGQYTADSTFWFPMSGIDPQGKIELVIEHETSGKSWVFPFDLSKIR